MCNSFDNACPLFGFHSETLNKNAFVFFEVICAIYLYIYLKKEFRKFNLVGTFFIVWTRGLYVIVDNGHKIHDQSSTEFIGYNVCVVNARCGTSHTSDGQYCACVLYVVPLIVGRRRRTQPVKLGPCMEIRPHDLDFPVRRRRYGLHFKQPLYILYLYPSFSLFLVSLRCFRMSYFFPLNYTHSYAH